MHRADKSAIDCRGNAPPPHSPLRNGETVALSASVFALLLGLQLDHFEMENLKVIVFFIRYIDFCDRESILCTLIWIEMFQVFENSCKIEV